MRSERPSAGPPSAWRALVWAGVAYTVVVFALFRPTFGVYMWGGHERLFAAIRILHIHDLWRAHGPGLTPWFPEACFGYGWPFFTFYAPWGYWVGATLRAALGLDAGAATRLSFYASVYLSGVFMFGWAWRMRRGDGARDALWALAAAVLYVLAPYHLADVFTRGSLAESWAWAGLAGVFWAVEVARRRPWLGAWALAGAYALLMLSHNITALWGTAIVALWTLLTARRVRTPAVAALGGAWGALMSAVYWWPALGLLRWVRAGRVDEFLGAPEFLRDHALAWRQLVLERHGMGVSVAGPGDAFAVALGVAICAGLVVAVAAACRRSEGGAFTRRRLIVSLAVVAGLLFTMSPQMPWAWAPAPLRYVQYPWRLLVPTVCLSCGAVAMAMPGRRRRGAFAIPILLMAVAVVSGLVVAPSRVIQPTPPGASDDGLRAWYDIVERHEGHYAGSILRDYGPVWVDEKYLDPAWHRAHPAPASRLETLRGRAEVRSYVRRGCMDRWVVESAEETLVRVHVFDFPGWRLTIDGRAAPERLGRDADGLVALTLPPGRHRVVLRYVMPDLMRHARAVSVTVVVLWALVVPGGVAVVRIKRAKRHKTVRTEEPNAYHAPVGRTEP